MTNDIMSLSAQVRPIDGPTFTRAAEELGLLIEHGPGTGEGSRSALLRRFGEALRDGRREALLELLRNKTGG